jgi:hypothetical protein
MNWYKKSQSQSFQDWFQEEMEKTKDRRMVKKDPPSSENKTIILYRGFDADLNKLQKSGSNFIFSPKKSEQGVMWFSMDRRVAQGRGKHILEYPLQIKKHFQVIHYSDGSTYNDIPEEIKEQEHPTENCRFWGGIELPEGWFFSYKVEKHIICSVDIIVSPNMIKEDDPEEY